MHDAGRIVGGMGIVLFAIAGPLWVGSARGVKTVVLAKAEGGDPCIQPREEMRKNHPALLADWRERVVRLGDRVHRSENGLDVRISLTGTCLGCHGQASEFCDKCHAQVAVSLSCWQCHEPSVMGPR
ncbi:MAG TPA: sulfate reduction electron transfer complex DsrMKJOP subunit DsrJ [Polyangia bacterium]